MWNPAPDGYETGAVRMDECAPRSDARKGKNTTTNTPTRGLGRVVLRIARGGVGVHRKKP